MSITATFEADFASFQGAVRGAEVSLKSFETGAGRVETSLNKMVDSLSGRRLIQDANLMVEAVERIGGVSKLTTSDIDKMAGKAAEAVEKMRALGLDVPAGLEKIAASTQKATSAQTAMISTAKNLASALGVTFSVGAVVNFAQQVLAMSDSLVKASDRTGLTIEQVQRLSYVAEQSGNSLDQLTAAVGKLQVNLNDPKAQQSLRDLGVDLNALRSSGPYEQMRQLAIAFAGIKDPVQQAEHAVAVFGRSGLEILPTLKSEFDKLAQGVTVASDQQVRAMDAAGDALARLVTNAKTQATSLAGSIVLAGEQVAQAGLLKTFALFVQEGGPQTLAMFARIREAALETNQVEVKPPVPPSDPIVEYRKHLESLRNETRGLTIEQKELIEEGHRLNQSNSEIAAGLRTVSASAVDAYLKILDGAKKATEETEKLRLAEQKLYFDIKMFGIQQMEEMTKGINAELRKQMDAMGAAATQLFTYGNQAKASYDALFAPESIQGFEAELQKLDQWLASELKKLDAMAAAAGGAWKDQADAIRDILIKQYEQMFADIQNRTDDFSSNQLPDALGANDGRLGTAAEQATRPMVVSFSNAFNQIQQSAVSAFDQVKALMAMDEAYRKSGIFVSDGWASSNFRSSLVRDAGMMMPTSGSQGVTVNVYGGASSADGRAAADGFVSGMKQRGVQL